MDPHGQDVFQVIEAFQGNGSFGTPHWTGSDATTGDLVFTGLSPQETNYIVSSSYHLQGDLTDALRRTDPTLNASLTFNADGTVTVTVHDHTHQY